VAKQFIPSPEQQNIFDRIQNGRGHLIIKARAGTGKTTTLVHACELMQGKVFFGAYNSKIAKEIRERVRHLTNIYAKTFHAAGVSALNYRFPELKNKDPNPHKVADIIEAQLNAMDPMQAAYYEPLAPAMADIVSMAKQRGIGALPEFPNTRETWMAMVEQFDLLDKLPDGSDEDPELMSKLLTACHKVLARSVADMSQIDFDDMVYMPLVLNLRMLKHEWVLIDEAQDTNPTRRALAERMLAPGGRLVAVGDDYQAIYGFSGADNDALDQIRRRFNADVLPLTVTYRCPKAVVATANQWVPDIQAHETAPEGSVSTLQYEHILTTAQPGDAILCRWNKYLVGTCFRFIRAGIPARIEGRAIGQQLATLCKKWKVKDLDKLGERVAKWKRREMDKALAKKKETKAQEIEDRAETVFVLIERAKEQGLKTVDQMVDMLLSLFDDKVVDKTNMVTLCSAHRSKGLEWHRVFILGLYELMGRQCKQDWQTQQELNLQYVAVTRAQSELFDVVGVKEEKKQHNQEAA
jgi:superfamily I DNA/RNA helicase